MPKYEFLVNHKVIEKKNMKDDDEALDYIIDLKLAYPKDYVDWRRVDE